MRTYHKDSITQKRVSLIYWERVYQEYLPKLPELGILNLIGAMELLENRKLLSISHPRIMEFFDSEIEVEREWSEMGEMDRE